MLKLIWYYIHHYRPAWPYRLPIMFVMGVVPPTLTHWLLMSQGFTSQRAGEITFVSDCVNCFLPGPSVERTGWVYSHFRC